jgi:hypothetical protein
MAIVAKDSGGNFPKAPEGQWPAVCVDVIDLGMVETTWQGKTKQQHKIVVVFQIAELDEKGERYRTAQRFTLSMSDKANLRKFLESWRGKRYTDEEAREGVDIELMIGVNALIQIAHNDRGYADITSVMKLPKGMEQLEPLDYMRAKDRPKDGGSSGGPGYDDAPHPADSDDDLPF